MVSLPVSDVVAPIEVAHSASSDAKPDFLAPEQSLIILTWITFILMAVVLHKVAWKPVLRVLEERESSIRRALDDAATARKSLEELETKGQKIMADAEAKGREIMAGARSEAEMVTQKIQADAANQAKAMVQDAQREIAGAVEQARQSLRADTARLAVDISERILRERLDPEAGRAYVTRLAKEI